MWCPYFKRFQTGFTLAEMLIVLVVLGVVTMFTIPKVLSSRASEQNRALLTEAVAAINQVAVMAIAAGQTTPGSTFTTYMMDHMNSARTCQNADLEGCWFGFGERNVGLIEMTNGVVLADLDGYWGAAPTGTLPYGIDLDLNGAEGPNLVGEDRYYVVVNTGTRDYTNAYGTVKANGGVGVRSNGVFMPLNSF